MAYTYSWQVLLDTAQAMVKGLPVDKVTPTICDFISQDMALEYPWKQTITNSAPGTIPLIDSTQDYPASVPNVFRPLKAWLKRTDVTPNETRDLDIKGDLATDLYPRSWYGIRAVSLQQAIGRFRLEAAVQVPTSMQLELCVDYQANVDKVSGLNQQLWFEDKYAPVAMEGLLYWLYKLSDDSRAGQAKTDASGRIVGYTGQLGTYKGALNRMKNAEDFGYTLSVFPAQPMGVNRDQNALNIFGV